MYVNFYYKVRGGGGGGHSVPNMVPQPHPGDTMITHIKLCIMVINEVINVVTDWLYYDYLSATCKILGKEMLCRNHIKRHNRNSLYRVNSD